MIQLTRRDLEHAYDQVAAGVTAARRYRTTGERIAKNAIAGVEVLAGAAAAGLVAGRFGAPHLVLGGQQLPLDAIAGLGLHGLAFFGLFGEHGDHVHNFASGVLAQYVTRWGVGYGTHLREKAGLPRIAGGAGPNFPVQAQAHLPQQARAPLTAAELAGIAAQAR